MDCKCLYTKHMGTVDCGLLGDIENTAKLAELTRLPSK